MIDKLSTEDKKALIKETKELLLNIAFINYVGNHIDNDVLVILTQGSRNPITKHRFECKDFVIDPARFNIFHPNQYGCVYCKQHQVCGIYCKLGYGIEELTTKVHKLINKYTRVLGIKEDVENLFRTLAHRYDLVYALEFSEANKGQLGIFGKIHFSNPVDQTARTLDNVAKELLNDSEVKK